MSSSKTNKTTFDMSNKEDNWQVNTAMEEASGTGSVKKNKPPVGNGGKGGKPSHNRSDINVIQELDGYILTFGNQGQQSNYLKTKRAIADYFAIISDFGKEIYKGIKEGREPEFKKPEEPTSKATKAQLRKYAILFKRYLDNEEKYQREKTKVFRVNTWQCTPTMRNKLESYYLDFPTTEEGDDYVGLLMTIKEQVYSTDKTQYDYWRMHASFVKLADLKQEPMRQFTSVDRFSFQISELFSLCFTSNCETGFTLV
jgi:hypothetical protein